MLAWQDDWLPEHFAGPPLQHFDENVAVAAVVVADDGDVVVLVAVAGDVASVVLALVAVVVACGGGVLVDLIYFLVLGHFPLDQVLKLDRIVTLSGDEHVQRKGKPVRQIFPADGDLD